MRPDYGGGGLVNLMGSLCRHFGLPSPYPPLEGLEIETPRHVLLLVIDGLGYRHLLRREGHLRALLKGPMTSVFPPTTAAAITTLMTGLAPAQHAITGWFMHLKELGCVAAILPFRPRYGGYPFAEVIPEALSVFDRPSLFARLPVPSVMVMPDSIVHSHYSTAMQGKALQMGYQDGDMEDLFACLLGRLELPQRHFIYAYWPDLDRLAHHHGIRSPEVDAHFEAFDDALGRFLAAAKGTDTLLIAIADHGFVDGEEVLDLAEHPALHACLTLPLCGEPRAAYCYVHPRKAGDFERRMGAFSDLGALYRSEDLVKEGYFGPGRPHPKLFERIGDYVLLMKGNAIVQDTLLGERRFAMKGVHGGMSEAEMLVPLMVAEL